MRSDYPELHHIRRGGNDADADPQAGRDTAACYGDGDIRPGDGYRARRPANALAGRDGDSLPGDGDSKRARGHAAAVPRPNGGDVRYGNAFPCARGG